MRCVLKAVVLIQKVRDAICLNSNLAGKLLLGQQRNVNAAERCGPSATTIATCCKSLPESLALLMGD